MIHSINTAENEYLGTLTEKTLNEHSRHNISVNTQNHSHTLKFLELSIAGRVLRQQ